MNGRSEKKKQSFGNVLLTVLSFAQFFAAGIVLAMCADKVAPEDDMMFVFGAGMIIIAFLLCTVIHEGGHLLGGLLSGYKFACFRIFSLSFSRKKDGKIHMGSITTPGMGGQCLMSPPELKDGKLPFKLYHAGGFLLNLVVGVMFTAAALHLGKEQYIITVVWGMEFTSPAPVSPLRVMAELACWMMAIMNLCSALVNGIPLRTNLISNDGRNMIDLSRSADALRRHWADMKIAAGIWQDDRLKDMPEEWFAVPSDEELRENPMHAGTAVMYYSRLMDEAGENEQRMAEAKALSDRLLSDGVQLAGLHRAMLRMDRAFMEMLVDTPLEMVRREQISEWLDAPTRQIMKAMKKSITVLRIEYANALLIEKDAQKAEKVKAAFEKRLRKYPVLTDAESEKSLMKLVEQTHERRQAQEKAE